MGVGLGKDSSHLTTQGLKDLPIQFETETE